MVEKISPGGNAKSFKGLRKKRIIIPPEGIELNDDQESFLQGYICGKSGQHQEMGETEMDEIHKQILQIRSKYCERILEILLKEGELYHGDLAERLDIAPSGLNVVIKKMLDSTPPIIEMMEIGKYKIYTLTTRIKNYYKNQKFNSKYGEKFGDSEKGNLFLCLRHFIEVAGHGWKDELNLLLQEKEGKENTEVMKVFRELMKIVIYAAKYNQEEIAELKRFLDNDMLVYLVQRYLEIDEEVEKVEEEIKQWEGGERLLKHLKNRN